MGYQLIVMQRKSNLALQIFLTV